jgi:hypothetical protein
VPARGEIEVFDCLSRAGRPGTVFAHQLGRPTTRGLFILELLASPFRIAFDRRIRHHVPGVRMTFMDER